MASEQRRLGMQIATMRNARELTQEALARKAGISLGYLARLETGRQDPSLATLRKLAKALKVKLADLLK